MLLKVCDILNTFCQSFLFIWICNNIASKGYKVSRLKIYLLMTLIFSDIVSFTYMGINSPLANFLMMVIIMLLIVIFYRKSILSAFIGFGLTYFIITVTSYFPFTLYQNYFSKLDLNISTDLSIFLFLYIPAFLFYPIFYILRRYIFNVGMFFKSLKNSMIIVQLINYALLFVNTLFMEWISENMNPMFKATLYATFFMVFVFTAIYFAKINDKSKEIELLNVALNEKLTELKKIKHDYGSEISGLYGLYQLGKMDRLGALLKGIIEKNQSVTSAVSVNMEANSLIESVLQTATSAGISVIVEDSCDYGRLAMTDNEILKLISNIIRNAIDALSGAKNPIIKFKSYNSYTGIGITISNNGPEIPLKIKNRLFEQGFSTKENSNADRGYGLSIVKDIINKYSGRISIESDKEWTQFNIEVPFKPAYSVKLESQSSGGGVFEESN